MTFTQSEKAITKAIRESDAPFLGLLGENFANDVRAAIERAIRANPTVAGYVMQLEAYPGLFAVNLAWHVMQGMGQDGHFSLYPHIQQALGINHEPGQNERAELWTAFRRSLLALGLEPSAQTSGAHYMANEYLRQAGVPLAFVDDLAARMLSFAKKVGLPEDDDPEGIAAWQSALDARLGLPFSQTARKALALDRQGYYTRVFLRVHAAGGQVVNAGNVLEAAMARAFRDAGTTPIRRAALPRVMLHDGSLGVFFPGGEDQEWSLEVDGTARSYRTVAEDRFIPFTQTLPTAVTVRGRGNGQEIKVKLWEDDRPNRLLFFSETGRLVARGQLAQADELSIPPGRYTVLARFVPKDVETEELADEPALYSFALSLEPGEKRVLANGPARLTVRAECSPLVRWLGETHTSREGVEFRHGQMDLDVVLPTDWLGQGAAYELTLHPGGQGQPHVQRLQVGADGKAQVDVANLARQVGWNPGLMRLVVELRRAKEARILLRTASLYWLGLAKISRGLRFHCTDRPLNLKLEFSENVERDGNDLVLKDAAARLVRLVFALSDKRQQSLTWNVPGVFVEVETVADGGASNRTRRALGSTETVSLTSSKQIVVIASDPGTLRLGDWSLRVDFSRHASKVLGAAFLANRLMPGDNVLWYENEVTGTTLKLLRLTQPHEVDGFSAEVQSGQLLIRMHVNEVLEAVAVHASALQTDDEDAFTLKANDPDWTRSRFGRARLMVEPSDIGHPTAYVYIDLEYWPKGAWLFNLDARIKGVWGRLQNERQEVFSAGLLWAGDGQTLAPKAWLEQLDHLEDKPASELLGRLHAALQICFAQEAWERLVWLGEAWQALAQRWHGREAQALPILADMVAMRPPPDSSPSWVPQLSIAATLPGLFALAAGEYRRVNEKPHPITQALRAIFDMTQRWPAVFPDLLHSSAAAACGNFRAIDAGGVPPQDMDPQRYIEALHSVPYQEYEYPLSDEDTLPGPGSYLGPLHYRHAWRALEIAYEQALPGNDTVRGQALGLAQQACRRMPRLDEWGVPAAWRGRSPHLDAWPADPGAAEQEEMLQQRENLDRIAHLLAGLALVCRQEARTPGTLDRYLSQLNQAHFSITGPLAFLLQIGEGLFAYYLLLWEFVLKTTAQGANHE